MRVVPGILVVFLMSACGPAGGPSGELGATHGGAAVLGDRDEPERLSGASDGDGRIPITSKGPEAPATVPNVAEIRGTLFVPSCATGGCHDSATADAGLALDLEGPALLDRLLRPAVQSPGGMPLVTQGNPGASYLYLKVFLEVPLVGDAMPPAEALEPEQVAALRAWIEAGTP